MATFLGRTISAAIADRIVAAEGGGDRVVVLTAMEARIIKRIRTHVREFEIQQAQEAATSDFDL